MALSPLIAAIQAGPLGAAPQGMQSVEDMAGPMPRPRSGHGALQRLSGMSQFSPRNLIQSVSPQNMIRQSMGGNHGQYAG